jgi:hypothetical protein
LEPSDDGSAVSSHSCVDPLQLPGVLEIFMSGLDPRYTFFVQVIAVGIALQELAPVAVRFTLPEETIVKVVWLQVVQLKVASELDTDHVTFTALGAATE